MPLPLVGEAGEGGSDDRNRVTFAIFLAKAWILDEKSEQLEQSLDVPWRQRGDPYDVRKLTVCVEAHGKVVWVKKGK
jgi:hypothetical protein